MDYGFPILCQYWIANIEANIAQYRKTVVTPCLYWVNIGYNIDPILFPMLDQYCTNVVCYMGRCSNSVSCFH